MEEGDEEGRITIDCGGEAVDWIAILQDLIAYILYMHRQIPEPLDQLDCFMTEHIANGDHENAPSNARERRERIRKARAMKMQTRKVEKLKESIQALVSTLQAAFRELPHMPSVLLVLGPSSKRPFATYEVQFYNASTLFLSSLALQGSEKDTRIITKSLSRKITRALISHDRGTLVTGPMKLFAFIKAHATISLPPDFIPKQCNSLRFRKIGDKEAPSMIIQLVCSSPSIERHGSKANFQHECFTTQHGGTIVSNDSLWFQCKLHVKVVSH